VARPTRVQGSVLMWLAQTLSVLSRLITRRTFFVSLWARRRTSPVPLSFHSEDEPSKRNNLARLSWGQGTDQGDRAVNIHLEGHILILLVCLCVDLLCELNNGLELRIGFLFLKAKSRAASDQEREKGRPRSQNAIKCGHLLWV